MGFIVETPPVLRHKCDVPAEWFKDEKGLIQPTYAHLTIWQCDECKRYFLYHDCRKHMFYPLQNYWEIISEKKALKLKSKWEK